MKSQSDNLKEEDDLENPRGGSCPCAYLIKHYIMKAYGGVDV
jgi:hypothetical protein